MLSIMTRSKLASLVAWLLVLCVTANFGTCSASAGIVPVITGVTWQDPENAVVLWDAEPGYTYRIYRSEQENGKYDEIGTSSSGAYLDDTVTFPQIYWYRIQAVAADGSESEPSAPVMIGTNSRSVHEVIVVMYHDFITQEDVENGVVFGEYALDPSDFEADLQYLRSNGYTTITSHDLIEYLHGNQPLPPKAIIISIDDGTHGVYTSGWPLLQKYGLKADLNVIGELIDAAWETVHNGGTRLGEAAPYCTWNELIEMVESGTINLCSHSYGLHRYDREGRIGLSMMDGEALEDYIAAVERDYRKVLSSMEGWTGVVPGTLAYPYSKRSRETDKVLLEHTSFEILMSGDHSRATRANFFVDGGGVDGSLHLMNRPCRMDGTPLADYLRAAHESDYANGVNRAQNTLALTQEECTALAQWYNPFSDVADNAWYSGNAYYTYVNALMTGTGPDTFSPAAPISRGMAAVILHRMAGTPEISGEISFADVKAGAWYESAACWAEETGILPGAAPGTYLPDDAISRGDLALSLYRFAAYAGLDTSAADSLVGFSDADTLAGEARDAMSWAVASGIFQGDDTGKLRHTEPLSRAQLAAILHRWNVSLQS